MKKLLRKRSLFLVALLVGLCMPTVLCAAVFNSGTQTFEIVDGKQVYKVYYIRNVATGLYLKSGGVFGTHAVEGRAAHPFAIEKVDGVYALSSINGYMASSLSYWNGILMEEVDRATSRWKFESAGSNGVYYLEAPNGNRLSSMSDVSGHVNLVAVKNNNDDRQKWEILTKEEIVPDRIVTATALAVDVTPLIEASSFDLVDQIGVGTREDDNGNVTKYTFPLYSSSLGLEQNEEFRNVAWQTTQGEGASYNGVWSYNQPWSTRDVDPAVYNSSFLTRNNVHGAFTVSQEIDVELPEGDYTFTFQGFYARRHSLMWLIDGQDGVNDIDVEMVIKVGNNETVSYFDENEDITNEKFISGEQTMSYGGKQLKKDDYVAAFFRDRGDEYLKTIPFSIPEGGSRVTIEIRKGETSEKHNMLDWSITERLWPTWQNMIACDNLTLTYHGVKPSPIELPALYYEKVKAAYLFAVGNVKALSDVGIEGCQHWNVWDEKIAAVRVDGVDKRGNQTATNTRVAYLNNNPIDTEPEFKAALSQIEAAYQAALAAHKDAANNFITNPSFENGFASWVGGDDSWVKTPANDAHYETVGINGNKLFSSYGAGIARPDGTWEGNVDYNFCARIEQTVTGLENGLYELKALLTSYPGYRVYLLGNNYMSYIEDNDVGVFKEATLYFLVENGTAIVGAIGGHHRLHNRDHVPTDGVHKFDCYWPGGGGYFKADNFRLTRVCDVNHGKLKLALDEAQIAFELFDSRGQNVLGSVIQKYNDRYANTTAISDSDVAKYVEEIHTTLSSAAKSQRDKGSDMTYAIIDPNFEWGSTISKTDNAQGWICKTGGDTGIREQSHGTFQTAGVDGRFLFNTWDGGVAQPLKQKVDGIPNGKYRVRAVLATDGGADKVILTANGVSKSATTYASGTGEFVELECDVIDNTLNIEAKGKDNVWFKADDFRLTFIGNTLSLRDTQTKQDIQNNVKPDWYTDFELDRPIASGKWHSFIVPFDIEDIPENWDVRQLVNSTVDETGYHLYLEFSDPNNNPVAKIEANKPYMVRYYPNGIGNEETTVEYFGAIASQHYLDLKDGWATPTADNPFTTSRVETKVDVTNEAWGSVEFIGTYVNNTSIPKNAFYVSNNKFYFTGDDDTKTMKGYRAYFKQKVQGNGALARSFGMRSGETSDIQSKNNVEVKVVGIYNANGMKLEEMQDGLNIVKMSDGSSVKILIK